LWLGSGSLLLLGSGKHMSKAVENRLPETEGARQTFRAGGFTVFFTGLSGAGKSTLALALQNRLLKERSNVKVLDGNMFRTQLSRGGEYPRAFRKQSILRAVAVAEEVTRAGGIAICAAIAPNEQLRRRVREAIERWGAFILVHVSTPLAVCERRDCNGLYRQARAGLLDGLTGVTDAYEAPEWSDLEIDTSDIPVETAVEAVIRYLRDEVRVLCADT